MAGAAIDAAETGHLVISSMRTSDPADTIQRLISMFPESQRGVVRNQLAAQVKAVVSQILFDAGEAAHLVLACEILTSNERTREWILGREDPSFLFDVMKEGGFHGMQTFDQALLDLVVNGQVQLDAVLPHVRNIHEVKAKAQAAGIQI